jgi:hypothetical protein
VVGRGFSPEIGDEGAVSGRLTDGYLTASGNFDADMNGMSGSGPYYQQVGGKFYLDSVQNRFPCSLTVSFWRNTFTSSDPPASAELTDNRVRITCLAGQFAIQGGTLLLNPGEYYEFVGGIPLSATGDPRSATGTYSGFATCDNTQVSIQARIEWNVQPRVHVLLGIVRECYEEGNPCATACSGSQSPNALYLRLSGSVTLTGTLDISRLHGTYIANRTPNLCKSYFSWITGECSSGYFLTQGSVAVNHGDTFNVSEVDGALGFSVPFFNSTGVCSHVGFGLVDSRLLTPCGPGTIATGSAAWVWAPAAYYATESSTGTLNWEVSS